ncbi:MAG: S41 family peptidase, partial [Syntrophomonadaceae bacterium]|nr:S41 family peptidase [Syntrophomonadaceae bacterium]
ASTPVMADDNADSTYLQGVMQFIKNRYNYEIGQGQLTEGSVKGMFEQLDEYSEFYTREDAQKFLESVDGNYEGIGIALSKDKDYIVIIKVFPASPAETAGLLSGDKIVTVDQKDVIGSSIDEVTTLIRGERGSLVTLGIIRNSSNNVMEISAKREGIKLNPVNGEIREGIGYISIDSFNSNTNEYLKNVLKEMDAARVSQLILDLRDNTGGEVAQAVAVARHFVPAGTITTLKFRSGDDDVYTSALAKAKYQIAVLVNKNTASASEILSGAIQDSKAGILVGSKTYGKARVQSLVPFLTPEAYNRYSRQFNDLTVDANDLILHHNIQASDSEVLGWAKITTGTYLTPAGKFIDGKGLVPDINIEDPGLVNGIEVRNISQLNRSSKPSLNSSDMNVYNAEKILAAAGYQVDKPDLNLDVKTWAAIKKFQKETKLYPSGVLDYATQEAFNKQRQKLLLRFDLPYAKAIEYLK